MLADNLRTLPDQREALQTTETDLQLATDVSVQILNIPVRRNHLQAQADQPVVPQITTEANQVPMEE
jgi:hypothetical protein